MNLEECYKILQLDLNADLNQLKSAFRKQAFACHPDLHPQNPDAAEKFRQLNQAYLLILEHLSKKSAQQEPAANSSARSRAYREYTRHRQNSEEKKQTSTDNQYYTRRQSSYGWRQEEIFKNILKDPYAKKVFEEIFQKIKRNKTQVPQAKIKPLKKRKLSLQDKAKKEDTYPARMRSYFKNWINSQLNHEYTLYLEPRMIIPGSNLKFQVKQRLTGTITKISTRIPNDYLPGRPIRLKGLGRKLGPWKGDLYLRIMAK